MRILSRIKVNPDTIRDAIGAAALFATLIGGLWILHGCDLSGL